MGPVTGVPAPLVILAINVKTLHVQSNHVTMAEAVLLTDQGIIALVQQVIRVQIVR